MVSEVPEVRFLSQAARSQGTKHHSCCTRLSQRPPEQSGHCQICGTDYMGGISMSWYNCKAAPSAVARCSWWLQEGKCHTCPHIGQEKASGELQAMPQSPKRLWSKSWVCCVQLHQGQDNWEQPAQIYQRQFGAGQSPHLLQWNNSMDYGRAMGSVYFDTRKVFALLGHADYKNGWNIGWTAVQKAVSSSTKCSWLKLCRKCLNGWDEDEQVYTLYTCNPNGLGWGDHLKVI